MTTYRAPIRDMRFVINELAGLKSLAALPGYEEVTAELAEAVLGGGGENRRRGVGAPQQARRRAGRIPDRRMGRRGRRLWRGLSPVCREWLERVERRPRIWRAGTAFADHGCHGRDVELGQYELRSLPFADRRGDGGDQSPWLRRAEAPVSAKARQRRVVGHDEPDRAAGGFRSVGRPHQGSPGGRPLPHLRPEDLHHLGRSRHDRKCRASGARPPSRRAGGNARHLAVSGAQIPRWSRRLTGGAQRCRVRVDRAQARHPCEPDLRDELWREGGCRRLPGGPGKRGPAAHVHDDERSPAEGRTAGSGDRRTRLSGGARLCQGAGPGPAGGAAERRPRNDHSPPRCAPHAADDEVADRGDARARLCAVRRRRFCAQAPRCGANAAAVRRGWIC